MLMRENALAQLDLLRQSDNVQIKTAAETVLWLDRQLTAGDLCPEKFCRLVGQYRDQFDSPSCTLSAVCADALTNIIDTSRNLAV